MAPYHIVRNRCRNKTQLLAALQGDEEALRELTHFLWSSMSKSNWSGYPTEPELLAEFKSNKKALREAVGLIYDLTKDGKPLAEFTLPDGQKLESVESFDVEKLEAMCRLRIDVINCLLRSYRVDDDTMTVGEVLKLRRN